MKGLITHDSMPWSKNKRTSRRTDAPASEIEKKKLKAKLIEAEKKANLMVNSKNPKVRKAAADVKTTVKRIAVVALASVVAMGTVLASYVAIQKSLDKLDEASYRAKQEKLTQRIIARAKIMSAAENGKMPKYYESKGYWKRPQYYAGSPISDPYDLDANSYSVR